MNQDNSVQLRLANMRETKSKEQRGEHYGSASTFQQRNVCQQGANGLPF